MQPLIARTRLAPEAIAPGLPSRRESPGKSVQRGSELTVARILRRERDGAGEDLLGEVGALLALQEAGGEETVFGEAGAQFVRAGGRSGSLHGGGDTW